MADPSHKLRKFNIYGFPHKKEYRQFLNKLFLGYYHPMWKGYADRVGVSIGIMGCSISNLFFDSDIINSNNENLQDLDNLFVCYILDYIDPKIRKDNNIIVIDEYGIEELCSILKPTSIANIEIGGDLKKYFKQDDSCKYYYLNSQRNIDTIIWIKKNLKLFAKNTEMYLYYGHKGVYWNFSEIELYNSLYSPLLQNPSNNAINLIEICRNIDFYCEDEARDNVDSIFKDIYYWPSPYKSYALYKRQGGIGFDRMMLTPDIRHKFELSISKIKERERIDKENKERLDYEYRLREQEKRRKEKVLNSDYNSKNIHGRDSKIIYNDSHYYLHDQILLGITRIISNFFPKFDAEYWAEVKAPLMGKTPQQLLEEWDRKGKESSEAGTKLHQRIDDYYHNKEVQTEDKDYTLFKQFAAAYKLNPYRTEWAIYDEDSGIVGVVDMLDYSNGEYILYDWKRSEKVIEGGQPITKNKFNEYGLRPIEDVPNTDYWHYALQLSFYRYILEKNYGIKVKESRLVVLHPTLNLPVVLTTPYMIDEVNKIIAVIKM